MACWKVSRNFPHPGCCSTVPAERAPPMDPASWEILVKLAFFHRFGWFQRAKMMQKQGFLETFLIFCCLNVQNWLSEKIHRIHGVLKTNSSSFVVLKKCVLCFRIAKKIQLDSSV